MQLLSPANMGRGNFFDIKVPWQTLNGSLWPLLTSNGSLWPLLALLLVSLATPAHLEATVTSLPGDLHTKLTNSSCPKLMPEGKANSIIQKLTASSSPQRGIFS